MVGKHWSRVIASPVNLFLSLFICLFKDTVTTHIEHTWRAFSRIAYFVLYFYNLSVFSFLWNFNWLLQCICRKIRSRYLLVSDWLQHTNTGYWTLVLNMIIPSVSFIVDVNTAIVTGCGLLCDNPAPLWWAINVDTLSANCKPYGS
jgi:hypothetical protein